MLGMLIGRMMDIRLSMKFLIVLKILILFNQPPNASLGDLNSLSNLYIYIIRLHNCAK